MNEKYIKGWLETPVGRIPITTATLSGNDRWNNLLVRLSIKRMKYKVAPGLYALGKPTNDSLVMVTANYKLSFDILRKSLKGLDVWIMVLDTKGINVWCAAGKGTFGTEELVKSIENSKLHRLVSHRKILVPQLGAPGISAYTIRQASGFSVIYGPVRAEDTIEFIEAGYSATPEMRQVRFNLLDRLKLVPVEFVQGLKYLIFAIALFFILSGFNSTGYSTKMASEAGFRPAVNLLLAYLAGVLVGPALLPWLPGRSFFLKGIFSGLIVFLGAFFCELTGNDYIEVSAWAILIMAISSFLTMNFTGASTYTSLSGVKKEMRIAVPLQVTASLAGITAWFASLFIG